MGSSLLFTPSGLLNMVSPSIVGFSLLLYAIGVTAAGVFPPIPPGALGDCGSLPTDALCSTVFTACNKTLVWDRSISSPNQGQKY